MEGFRPEQLDLDRLYANLAQRKQELAQYVEIVKGLDEGADRFAWSEQVARVRAEIGDLEDLIKLKRKHDQNAKKIT